MMLPGFKMTRMIQHSGSSSRDDDHTTTATTATATTSNARSKQARRSPSSSVGQDSDAASNNERTKQHAIPQVQQYLVVILIPRSNTSTLTHQSGIKISYLWCSNINEENEKENNKTENQQLLPFYLLPLLDRAPQTK